MVFLIFLYKICVELLLRSIVVFVGKLDEYNFFHK